MEVFLTVVVCWDVQNAAFTNQSGEDYKPYWGMWEDGTNFAASMSAGRVLKSLIVKRVREEKDCGTMNRERFR